MQAKNSTMTHADFESVVGDIASFFKDDKYGVSHRSVNYRATSEEIDELCEKLDLVSVDNESTTEEEVKEVKKLKGDCKNDLNVDIKHFNEEINKHTKNFESAKNQDDFKKRVHEIAENARVASNKMISHWEEKIISTYSKGSSTLDKIGNAVARALVECCAAAVKVYTEVLNFFEKIIDSVVNWLKHAWDSIKTFFDGVYKMISILL